MIRWGASFTLLIEDGEYGRLFTRTCFFISEYSIFLTTWCCFCLLGDVLERQIGHLKYLLIYVGGGVGGRFSFFLSETSQGELVVSAGASGEVLR